MTFGPDMAWSDEVLPERILGGRFVRYANESFIATLRHSRIAVITEFGLDDLRQLFVLGRIAHDLHASGTALRNITWGSVYPRVLTGTRV